MTEATIASDVNIGTMERPVWVPEPAIEPDTKEGQNWWEMLAEGSIVISDELQTAILKFLGKHE